MPLHSATISGYRPLLILLLSILLVSSAHGDGSELIVDYLERYHKLSEKDVDGRMNLADWCKRNELHQQRPICSRRC